MVHHVIATGLRMQSQGDLLGAEECFAKVLSQEPENQDALFRFGVLRMRQGMILDAMSKLQRVLQLDTRHAEAYNNLGVMLAQHNRFAQAIACFHLALRSKPSLEDARRNLNQAISDQERQGGDCVPMSEPFQVALAAAEIYYSQGMTLLGQGHILEAEQALGRAVQINPDHGMSHYGLGLVSAEQGELENALAQVERALKHAPQSADLRYDRARLLLQLGDFERGWSEFECRWKVTGAEVRAFPQPLWNGAPLNGRTILLHGEQGIGDVFQFIRYTAFVKDRTKGNVLVACPPSLHRILASCPGVDAMVGMGPDYPPFDVHIPLMSLPGLVKTTLETIPNNVPYLFPAPELVEYWKQDLDGIRGFKVGIVWQGSPTYKWDHQRSIPLYHFASLAQVPGVRLLSLQKGPAAEQLRAVADRWPIIDLDRRLDEHAGAFVDTAAVMKNLDLVVTADTSAAHLAGALGVPVWLAQWHVPEWRWLYGKDTSPWYPSMRLFRQARKGDWGELFSRIASQLMAQLELSQS